jgi:hypothetical protein
MISIFFARNNSELMDSAEDMNEQYLGVPFLYERHPIHRQW